MAGYTDADLERARELIDADFAQHSVTPLDSRIAQRLADVRNETIERCAGICDAHRQRMERSAYEREKQGKPTLVASSKEDAGRSLAEAIRALKDGAK